MRNSLVPMYYFQLLVSYLSSLLCFHEHVFCISGISQYLAHPFSKAGYKPWLSLAYHKMSFPSPFCRTYASKICLFTCFSYKVSSSCCLRAYYIFWHLLLPAILLLCCCRCLARKYDTVCDFRRKHRTTIRYIIWGILLTGK